jgi:outer membrane protein OmpA-like peptidoglycan-associated protein
MKAFYFLALAMVVSSNALCQSDSVINTDPPYYVVVGVFSIPKNAVLFSKRMPRYQLTGKYEMNFNKGLHYVYVMKTNDRTQAIDEALRLRARPDSLFSDAWVYHGSFQKPEPGVTVTNTVIVPVAPKPQPDSTRLPPLKAIEKKSFLFRVTRKDDATEVKSEVVVVDVDRAKKIGSFEGNKIVQIERPEGKSGLITVTTHMPGYRRIQHTVNFLNPSGDSVQIQDSTIVLSFELIRLQKGDIALSEIYFFRDAAIMRPESRYEVTSLADMMSENPRYRIRIHGHTNGNDRGRIIYMKDNPEEWFALKNTKEGSGSAKKLSEERAEVVRKYLVSQGIDPKRMEVKAWGGKKPIFDKLSPQAQSNVRVEIEILQN